MAIAHAWIIPELYAFRGASVVRYRRDSPGAGPSRWHRGCSATCWATTQRELQRRSGLALERGGLGTWLVGEGGALLVAPGWPAGATASASAATDAELPPSDRIAHLLLALRSDEQGFATVANLSFAGAPWRIRRRLPAAQREALDAARRASVR